MYTIVRVLFLRAKSLSAMPRGIYFQLNQQTSRRLFYLSWVHMVLSLFYKFSVSTWPTRMLFLPYWRTTVTLSPSFIVMTWRQSAVCPGVSSGSCATLMLTLFFVSMVVSPLEFYAPARGRGWCYSSMLVSSCARSLNALMALSSVYSSQGATGTRSANWSRSFRLCISFLYFSVSASP